ncbi:MULTISPECIES: C40 family peptidase [Pseudomonas]|jgi:murein DD-endopeptidase|uniref:C40 family peptidase n=1 Tax=Pseudomonas TaxID=286 RepID=UPI00028840D7|nr:MULTISPECIES: C40 family peptidase [Pseudomonas]AMB77823.1 peptidase P60 [Pseudomonas fragi]MCB1652607.1 C40 family peptidase [Pseudomonadales bacterium]NBF17166.1 peptidase P60 [Pseudomonas sp. Fl4BN2]AUB73545.1 peptidase P60 [Pseudomonas sp. Lz4W]MCH4868143.1 peptidoglycan endopeptidase [Pseudomonas sp. TMW22089]
MRPLFKTWLTICLLMPLAAHATNREQHLPSGFTGYTAKSSAGAAYVASNSKTSNKTVARPASSKAHRKAPGKIANASLTAANMQSSTVLSRAVNVLGTPYRWGGSSPSKGFDCSGLVKYAFNDVAAVDLPRTSSEMASGHGQKVERKDLKPGDLLFFNIKSRKVNHVAIYLGNDRFIHAPRRGKSVTIDTLKKPYWQSHYVVAKRVLPKEKASLQVVQR